MGQCFLRKTRGQPTLSQVGCKDRAQGHTGKTIRLMSILLRSILYTYAAGVSHGYEVYAGKRSSAGDYDAEPAFNPCRR
jgi:hypothetical protein